MRGIFVYSSSVIPSGGEFLSCSFEFAEHSIKDFLFLSQPIRDSFNPPPLWGFGS
jgi:hypothetical protein